MNDTSASKASRSKTSLSFWLLYLFFFLLYFSPRNFFPALEDLHVPLKVGILLIITYVFEMVVIRREKIVLNMPVVMAVVFTVFAALLTPYSANTENSYYWLNDFLINSVVIFILVSNIIKTERELKLTFLLMSVGAFYIASAQIENYIMRNNVVNGRVFGEYSAISSTNPNDIALVLAYTVPIVGCLFVLSPDKFKKILYGSGMALVIRGIMMTFSRGGMLALMGATAVFFLRDIKGKKKVIFILILVLLLPVVKIYKPYGYTERILSITEPEYDYDKSAEIRKKIMNMAFYYTLSHPISYLGMGNNELMFREIQEIYPDEENLTDNLQVHNIFLQVGADLGMIPMLVFMLFIFTSYRQLSKSQKKLKKLGIHNERIAVMSKAMSLCFIVLLVGSLFAPIAYRWSIYIVAGISNSFAGITRRLAEEKESDSETAYVAET